MKSPIRHVSLAWTLASLLALGAQAVAAKKTETKPPPGGCDVYPIALSLSSVSNISTGTVLYNLENGADPGDFGWLTWNGNRSQDALAASLTTPGNVETYVNPFNPKEKDLTARKWVRATGSDKGRNMRAALDNLKKREIVVPLWYQVDKKEKAYRIAGFAKVQLLSYSLDNTDRISVRYLGTTDCHKGNDAPVVNAGEDQVIAYPARATLNGSATDDGLPRGATLLSTWSKVSGPGAVVFADMHNPVTLASFSDPGTYVLQLDATDSAKSASDRVTITLNYGNTAPTALAQTLNTSEDVAVNVTLSGSDPEGDALTFVVLSSPSFGTLSGTPPALVYTPNANLSGTDSFTFKVNDGGLDSAPATVTVNVAAVNDPPVAYNQSVATDEDVAVAVVLAGNDVEGAALAYTIVNLPVHGTLSGTAPDLVYTPAANYFGSDQFTFRVDDGALMSPVATVTLTVRSVNDAPVAESDSLVLSEDGTVDLVLRGNDVEGSALTFTIVTPPTHGVLSGTAPTLRYVPTANYNGADSFTFKVNDGNADSAVAMVSIDVQAVNDAPTALNDAVSLDEDASVDVVLRGSDVEGSALTFSVVTPPVHGVLSGTAPNVTYVPAANYNGADSFTFKVNDGALDSGVATVTLQVRPVNDAPVALNESVVLAEDGSVDLVLRGSDVEGSTLSFTVVGLPVHGTLSGTPPAVRYSPAANYNGADSFTFKVNDGTADSDVAVVNITVQPVNDAPVAVDDTASLDEDTGVNVVLQGSDVEGSALVFSIVTQPVHGVLSGTLPNVRYVPTANYFGDDVFTFRVNDGELDSAVATVTLTVRPVNDAPVALNQEVMLAEDASASVLLTGTDVEGSVLAFTVVDAPVHGTLSGTPPDLTYMPDANYHGPDALTFKVNDGSVDSALATVQITVTPVNDVPVAAPQSLSTPEDTGLNVTLSGTDVDGDSLTFRVVNGPAHGSLSGTAPNLTYTPAANYFGADHLDFVVNDGTVDSLAATVNLDVTPVNDPPVASPLIVFTAEDTAVSVTLSGSDVEGSELTYVVTRLPAHGSLSGSSSDVVYTPNANFNGGDSFAYRVFDGTDNSTPAEVTITVTPVNDPPVADAQFVQAIENETTTITLTGSDVDLDALTYTLVDGPTNGTLSGNAPNLTYVPDLTNRPETDAFTFTVSDGVESSTLATVTIDIIYNQPPVVSAGPDRVVRSLTDVITLAGSATDDGWPRNSTLQYSWQMKYGPGVVTFGDAASAVTSASFSERGLYVLELSASDSQYTSSDLVEVRVDMICSANPAGAVAWWPANYVPTETVAGNTAVFEGGVAYGSGKVGGAFTFDGIDGRVKVDPHPSLDLGAANSLTIEFWVNSADVSRSVRLLGWHSDLDVFAPDYGVNIFQSGGELHAQIYDTNNAAHEFAAVNVLTNNVWTHVAVTYDRTSGQGRIYINGAVRTTSNLGNFRPRTTFPLFFGHLLSDTSYFEGALDEITFYTRALNAQEVHEIYAANGTGKCPISANLPPLVNAGPDVYLQAPGVATLTGSATDDGQPAPSSLRAAWSVVSGPGNVTFTDSAALATTANFDSAGIYVLRLAVDDAATVSSDVVEVRVASVCTVKNIPGLVAWFTGNGHASDVVGGRRAQLAAGLGFANGRVASAFNFDGVNDCARVLGDSGMDVGAGAGFSFEFWVNSADVTRTARLLGYHSGLAQSGTNIGVNIFQQSGNLHAQIYDLAGTPHEFVTSGALTVNTWTHVVVTYDRTRGVARTYINGAQRIASVVGSYVARTVGNFHLGNLPFDVNYFRGLLDEVSVYNRTLDAQEVYELFATGGVGKCPNDLNQGPVVNAGPDVYLRDTAEVATLNGSATDDGLPPGYSVNSLWSVVDGPGVVSFVDAASPVTTATFNAPGIYVLRLSADDGLVSSSDLVEVRVASLCTVKDVPALVSWWPANGNGNDVVGVNHARLGGGLTFASGRVAAALRFDGTNDAVHVPAHPSLDVGQGNGLTLEFWVNSLDVARFTRLVGWHFGMGTAATNFGVNIYQLSGGISAQIYDTAGAPHEFGAASSLLNGVWTHVAVSYDRTTGLGRIYINGVLRTTSMLGIYQPRTSYNLYFGNLPSDTGFFRGMLDEVSLYNRPLDAQEVYDIYNSGPAGKCPKDQNQAPVVDAGPNVTLAAVSDVATLNGSVSDDALPAGAGVRALWSKLDGPGAVTFGDPAAPVTTASFTVPGIYVLNLAADDAAVLRNDVMEVRVAMPCSAAPSGLVAWWPGNGTAQEVLGGRDGRLSGGTAFASGRVSSAFSFDGTNDSVHVSAHPADASLSNGLTIEFWVNPVDVTRSGRMVSWHSGLPGGGTNFGVGVQMQGRTVNAQIYDLAGLSHDVNATTVLTNNVWTHVAVTYDRVAGQGRVYINGVLRTTTAVGSYTPRTTYKLYFGNVPFDPNFFRGLLDEISIYDHALTSNEVAAVFAAGAAGKCPPAPVSPTFAMEMSSSANAASVTVDEHGRRTAMTDGSGSTSYSYDAQGRLSRISKSWSAHAGAPAVETALVYDYDELGRFKGVHSTMVNGASMHYVWTDANQLREVVDPHSGSTVYHYDAAGKPVGYTYPDGVTGSRFGVLDNVTCNEEVGATVICDADGHRVRRSVTVGSRTVTTYYVVSPFTVTGAAQLVEELTFDSADPLFGAPAVTRVYVHGLHTISHEELENGAWELYFYE